MNLFILTFLESNNYDSTFSEPSKIQFTEFTFKNMFVRELLKNTSEYTTLRVVRNNYTSIFLLQSYACGYHSYVKVWNFTINDSQQCKIKKTKSLILRLLLSFMMTLINSRLKQQEVGYDIDVCALNL